MYYTDGSKYIYTGESEIDNVINIGWLSHQFSYNKGEVCVDVKNKILEIIYLKQCNVTRGLHRCDFCKSENFVTNHNNIKILLGHAEIWIPSISGNFIYASPTLIYHYIDQHNYLPPANYIESILGFDLDTEGIQVF